MSIAMVVIGLALPSVGPLLDHHFAERQPTHQHATLVPSVHIHNYEQTHVHYNGVDTSSGDVIALVNYDGTLANAVFAALKEASLESFLLFEPTSLFNIPPHPDALARLNYVAPPDKPPQSLL